MLDLAKLLHDAIGIESPRRFILVCALMGFLIFGCLGWLIEKGYRAKLMEQSKAAPAGMSLTTTGPQSPVVINNSGKVTITNDNPKPKAPPPKDKSK